MKKHILAMVGFGGMAGWHYDLIEQIDNLSVAGIWDIKEERREYARSRQIQRFWVSVDSGLLVQAEKLLGEELVYRMSALQLELEEAGAAKFVLPDGTALPDREEG